MDILVVFKLDHYDAILFHTHTLISVLRKFTISDAFHGYNCRSLGVLPQFYNCDIILTLCNTALYVAVDRAEKNRSRMNMRSRAQRKCL